MFPSVNLHLNKARSSEREGDPPTARGCLGMLVGKVAGLEGVNSTVMPE